MVMLYASKYKDVQKVVNICGRCDLRGGITERLGTEGIEEVQNKGEFEVRAGIGQLFSIFVLFVATGLQF